MKIRIFWIGKTRERFLTEGLRHYERLLGSMAKISLVEVREERGFSREKAVIAEGRRILKQTDSYILLDERGREVSSLEFARFLEGRSGADFVIGGPFGVSEEVRQGADDVIALSRMTLTHEMVRVLFLEQIYRAMTIIRGKEYHH